MISKFVRVTWYQNNAYQYQISRCAQQLISSILDNDENCRCELKITTWASYQIRKIAGCACAGNAGNVFPRRRFQRKLLVSDPDMHHGTCVTHVPWCMSGSLTCGDGENVPDIPSACAPAILRIRQEAHNNNNGCSNNNSICNNKTDITITVKTTYS